MHRSDIARVQAYLRKTLGSDLIHIDVPKSANGPVELRAGQRISRNRAQRRRGRGNLIFCAHDNSRGRSARFRSRQPYRASSHGEASTGRRRLPVAAASRNPMGFDSTSIAPRSRASAATRASGNPVTRSDGIEWPPESSARNRSSPVISGIFWSTTRHVTSPSSGIIKQLPTGRIGLDCVASRFQQRIEHVAHVPIIIDNSDYVRIFRGHVRVNS